MIEIQRFPSENTTPIRLAGVVRESIVDGPGLRFTIFCQGCPHHCVNCHNAETHDFSAGYQGKIENILKAIDENPLLQGVTFSGGEPACQPEAFLELARACKERNLNIWMYSGYRLEELVHMASGGKTWPATKEPRPYDSPYALRELLYLTDVLVDGKFQQSQRDLTLLYRGSKNQRVIDMRRSFQEGRITLYAPAYQ